MADGRVFEKSNAIDTLLDFMRYVGLPRIEALNFTVYNGYPLLSRTFLNSRLSKAIDDGYFLFIDSSSATKRQQVLNIANALNISVTDVKLIPKAQPL
jgi:hypothetical protein